MRAKGNKDQRIRKCYPKKSPIDNISEISYDRSHTKASSACLSNWWHECGIGLSYIFTTPTDDAIYKCRKQDGLYIPYSKKEGFGVKNDYPDRTKYTGQLNYNGEMDGFGTLEFPNGKIIEGVFRQGHPTAFIITTQRA